jgi:hypothetical protein
MATPCYPLVALDRALKLGEGVCIAAVAGGAMLLLLEALASCENSGLNKAILDLVVHLHCADTIAAQGVIKVAFDSLIGQALWNHLKPHLSEYDVGEWEALEAIYYMRKLGKPFG